MKLARLATWHDGLGLAGLPRVPPVSYQLIGWKFIPGNEKSSPTQVSYLYKRVIARAFKKVKDQIESHPNKLTAGWVGSTAFGACVGSCGRRRPGSTQTNEKTM